MFACLLLGSHVTPAGSRDDELLDSDTDTEVDSLELELLTDVDSELEELETETDVETEIDSDEELEEALVLSELEDELYASNFISSIRK